MLRKQYHFRKIGDDLHAWDVHRLIRLSRAHPVEDRPLEAFAELDQNWWFDQPGQLPSPRALAGHMALVAQADPGFPVLLCAEGRLMDGMHRLVKALLEGRKSVPAIRFAVTPPPDFLNPDPEALPYPDEAV